MQMETAAAPKGGQALGVRLVRREERAHWRELMRQHHYLGFDRIIGESLRYVASVAGEWVALLAWGSPALKCGVRDRWIGWDRALQWRRLHLVVNNVRFLILPGWNKPNLASRVLALNLKRLRQDWEICHGHPVLLAETFVDGARFRGTCYRAAGWQALGETRGFSKRNQGYWHHGHKKIVLVRPLVPDAVSHLVAPFLPPIKGFGKEGEMINVNTLPLEGEGGLMDLLRTIVDPRKPRGVRHGRGHGGGDWRVRGLVGSAQLWGDWRMGPRAEPGRPSAAGIQALETAFGTDDPAGVATTGCECS